MLDLNNIKFYYQAAGKSYGPLSYKEICKRHLPDGTYIWHSGLDVWIPIEQCNILKGGDLVTYNAKRNQPYLFLIGIAIFLLFSLCIVILYVINSNKGTNDDLITENKYSDYEYPESSLNDRTYYDVDDEFSMYLEKFYRHLAVYGHHPIAPSYVTIQFADLDKYKSTSHLHAVSFGIDNDDIIEIYVNPSSWEKANKAQRYWIMYHELSHDVLNIRHLYGTPEKKGELMYPYLDIDEVVDMEQFIEACHRFFGSLN